MVVSYFSLFPFSFRPHPCLFHQIDQARQHSTTHLPTCGDTMDSKLVETVTTTQSMVTGKNPSAILVAQAPDTEKSRTISGALLMADDPLTESPDPYSKLKS